jgi:plastocyanin
MRYLISTLGLSLLVSTALGGPARGTVSLSNGKSAGNAVIFLQGDAKAQPMKDAVVDQRDHKFLPHVSVVTVGTQVRFPNNDTVFHNVFTEYHAAKFDLGMYARGKSKYQTFDRTGVAVLMCSVHPEMSAYVVVVDTPYYAMTDSKGRFTISNVPAGKYRAQVWHESGEKTNEEVTVSEGGTLNLKTHR